MVTVAIIPISGAINLLIQILYSDGRYGFVFLED